MPQKLSNSTQKRRVLFFTLAIFLLATTLNSSYTYVSLSTFTRDQIFTSATHPQASGCMVSLYSLPKPRTTALGWMRYNCLQDLTRAAGSEGITPQARSVWDQHRLVRALKVPIKDTTLGYLDSVSDSNSPPRVVLLDDEHLAGCWYACTHGWLFGLPPPPISGDQVLAQRDRGIVFALSNTQGRVVVVEDHPNYKSLITHERLFRIALEMSQIPPQDRANPGRFLLVPYVSRRNPWAAKDATSHNDITDIFFVAGVGENSPVPGRRLRKALLGELLRAGSVGGRVIARDACSVCPNSLDHGALLRGLAQSRFCPVVPGDTSSSKRLSEVMAAACIPVFIGPPFHTMPISGTIPYQDFSVIMSVKNRPWLREEENSVLLDEGGELHPDPLSEALVNRYAVALDSMNLLWEYLKGIEPERVDQLRTSLHAYQHFFVFEESGNPGMRGAADHILAEVCGISQ